VQILTIEELPAELTGPWGALVWTDQDYPLDQALFRKARALGVPFADYGGLVAVEGKRVLAQVTVEYYPMTIGDGRETFVGVAGVVTRPDALRRGLCFRLLEEVHLRESIRGHRLAMLWTHRTWGAHRLYARLGYRDLYSPPTAVLPPRTSTPTRLPDGFGVRAARRGDAALLESIFARGTRGRYGFVTRFPNSFGARIAMGWRASKDHHLLFRGSRAVGYFFASENPRFLGIYEGMVTERNLLPPLLDSIQWYARGRWLALAHTTLVNDAREHLRARGFSLTPDCHSVLMARSISGTSSRRLASLRQMVRDSRFSCHRGDMF